LFMIVDFSNFGSLKSTETIVDDLVFGRR